MSSRTPHSSEETNPERIHEGGVTVQREKRIRDVVHKRQSDILIILENVHDPHNIGAVLRSCDSVGIIEVFVIYTADALSQETLDIALRGRSSSGAFKWVKTTLFHSVADCVIAARGRVDKILGTHLNEEAKSIYDTDMAQSLAIVFGNEKDGISDELYSELDGNIFIPQVGMVKSLNISVACAVTLYELFRQRSEKGLYDHEEGFDQGLYDRYAAKTPPFRKKKRNLKD